MSRNNTFTLVIMVWITILTMWVVNNLTTSLNNQNQSSVTLQGIPEQLTQQISTIQIDKDTVWVIDANSNNIKVITHDENGYNMTESEMNFSMNR